MGKPGVLSFGPLPFPLNLLCLAGLRTDRSYLLLIAVSCVRSYLRIFFLKVLVAGELLLRA